MTGVFVFSVLCVGLLVWHVAYTVGYRTGARHQEQRSAAIATRRVRMFNGGYDE